jgi:hypothetical protein
MQNLITCGHCKGQHESADIVRLCSQGLTFPCTWMVAGGYSEDGSRFVVGGRTEDGEQIIRDCGATSWETPRGWECEAGHSHVTAEVRHREGWDYATDADEAYGLRKYGVDAVAMDGSSI